MATVTHRLSTPSTVNTASYLSGLFNTSANDLIVAFVVAGGTVATGAMTESTGITMVNVGEALWESSASKIYCFVADSLSPTTSHTVTFTCTGDNANGCVIAVCTVAGMSRSGLDAVRQSAKSENQAGASAPETVFSLSALTGNPTLGVVGLLGNPATVTEPTGWTEALDTGYNTPATGLEYVFRNSGFTGTTITWGSSESTYGAFSIELDTSARTFQEYALSLTAQAYYPLGETSGDAIDASFNSNDGTVTLGSGVQDAVAIDPSGDGSVEFDGASTRVAITDHASIQNVWDGGGSLVALIRPDSNGEGGAGIIIGKDFVPWNIRINGGTLDFIYFFSGDFGEWAASSAQIHGVMYFLGITYNASATTNDPTFYLKDITNNGSLQTLTVGSGLTEVQAPTGTRTSDIGSVLNLGNESTSATTWDGLIDELGLYTTVLTSDQMTQLADLVYTAASTAVKDIIGGGIIPFAR